MDSARIGASNFLVLSKCKVFTLRIFKFPRLSPMDMNFEFWEIAIAVIWAAVLVEIFMVWISNFLGSENFFRVPLASAVNRNFWLGVRARARQ